MCENGGSLQMQARAMVKNPNGRCYFHKTSPKLASYNMHLDSPSRWDSKRCVIVRAGKWYKRCMRVFLLSLNKIDPPHV